MVKGVKKVKICVTSFADQHKKITVLVSGFLVFNGKISPEA